MTEEYAENNIRLNVITFTKLN